MSTTQFSTKDRILGAAEELFAQHGFGGTSLRQVTSRADVNIAAVNYHFGSKENLINEVFRRRMDEMSRRRLELLSEAREASPGALEPLLAAFIQPALALARDRHGGVAFIRVIARAYAEKNDGLRKFLSEQYGHVLREFAKAIAECVPGLGKDQLYWRLDFLAGALTYAMSDFGLIKRQAGVSEAGHRKRAAEELIRFAAAGIRADAAVIDIE
jgi:AcrR family transcriptional regulator